MPYCLFHYFSSLIHFLPFFSPSINKSLGLGLLSPFDIILSLLLLLLLLFFFCLLPLMYFIYLFIFSFLFLYLSAFLSTSFPPLSSLSLSLSLSVGRLDLALSPLISDHTHMHTHSEQGFHHHGCVSRRGLIQSDTCSLPSFPIAMEAITLLLKGLLCLLACMHARARVCVCVLVLAWVDGVEPRLWVTWMAELKDEGEERGTRGTERDCQRAEGQ